MAPAVAKVLSEPKLLFGPEPAHVHWDILAGLAQIHPYDYNAGTRKFSTIRLSVVTIPDC